MKRTYRVWIIAAACLAGTATLWIFAHPDDSQEPPRVAKSHGSGLEELRVRVDAQGAELAALRDDLARIEGLLARRPATPGPSVAQAAAPAADPDPAGELAARRWFDSDAIGALRQIALDGSRSTPDRVQAVHELWQSDLQSSRKGSRTPEVVDALLELLESESNAEMRRQICFNVLDAAEDRHVGTLLRCLRADPAAEVRAQAADTLQAMQHLPRVRAELQWSSAHDSSEVERSTAADMLGRWNPKGPR